MARGSDPVYLGAKTSVDVATARKDQAVGAMLPQISFSGSTNTNQREYQTRIKGTEPTNDKYNSNSAQVNLTQPIWRYANMAGVSQAAAVSQQASYQLAGAEQELFGKLATAWLDVLAARDSVYFTLQQATVAQRQWEIARRGGELGNASPPQIEEARAKLDQALADVISAETEAEVKHATLEQLVGPLQKRELPYMRSSVTLADIRSSKLETWLETVETQNPGILAARYAFEAASEEVRKQRAGHQPTLDLVGSYGRNSQAVGGFPGQAGYTIHQNSIGLQLNVPIFSGGAQSAKVDEAIAQKEKARLDIEAARRTAILGTKQAWFGWHAAYARATAGAQSLRAARAALELAKRGSASGLKSELDVFQAEQQMHAAQRDLRKGRYDQVATYVRLKGAAGLLTLDDMRALDALFVLTPDDLPEQKAELRPNGPDIDVINPSHKRPFIEGRLSKGDFEKSALKR